MKKEKYALITRLSCSFLNRLKTECYICDKKDGLKALECGHSLCINCITGKMKKVIEEKTDFKNIVCKCNTRIDIKILQSCSSKLFSDIDEMIVQKLGFQNN